MEPRTLTLSAVALGLTLACQAAPPGRAEAEAAPPGDTLVVRCVDETGAPVPDALLHHYAHHPSGGRSRYGPVDWGSDGEHTLQKSDLHSAYDSIDGLTLTVISAARGRATREVAPTVDRVEIVLQPPCTVTFDVTDAPRDLRLHAFADPVPGEGAPVRRHGLSAVESALVEEEGRATLGPLQPGEYDVGLQVTRPGDIFERDVFVRQRVTLDGGPRTIRLSAPRVHGVELFVPGANAGSRVILQREGDLRAPFERDARLDADLRARFADVPEGRFRVSAWPAEGFGEMLVTVPPARVVFTPSEVTGLRVTRVFPGMSADRAGLRVGDVLVGTLDERFNHQGALGSIDTAGGEVTLLIERDGVELRRVLTVPAGSDPYRSLGVRTLTRLP